MTKDELIACLWSQIRVANSPEALDGYFQDVVNDQEIFDMAEVITEHTYAMPMFVPIHNNESGFEAAIEDEAVEETCFRLIIESPTFQWILDNDDPELFILGVMQECLGWLANRKVS